jgi:hypothetical protein
MKEKLHCCNAVSISHDRGLRWVNRFRLLLPLTFPVPSANLHGDWSILGKTKDWILSTIVNHTHAVIRLISRSQKEKEILREKLSQEQEVWSRSQYGEAIPEIAHQLIRESFWPSLALVIVEKDLVMWNRTSCMWSTIALWDSKP